MNIIRQFDTIVNENLMMLYKPTVIKAIIHLLIILYATRLAPTLPQEVLQVFENAYFKLFIFALILWTAQFSPSTSVLIALAFMMTMNYVNKKPLWEFLENTPNGSVLVTPQVVNTSAGPVVVTPQVVNTPSGPVVVPPQVTAPESSCYPRRMIDMTKVEGVNDMFPAELPQTWSA